MRLKGNQVQVARFKVQGSRKLGIIHMNLDLVLMSRISMLEILAFSLSPFAFYISTSSLRLSVFT